MRLTLSAGEVALEVALDVVRGTRRALEGDQRDEVPLARSSWPPAPPRRPRAASGNGASATTTAPAPPPPPAEAVEPPPPVPPATAVGDAVPVVPPSPGAKEVDDAPVPVAEFGGEGAEEDAGAEVHVDPPWDGYDDMTAAQIAERLEDAGREMVATVALYEGMKRDRRSVVRAADRRLRALENRPGA